MHRSRVLLVTFLLPLLFLVLMRPVVDFVFDRRQRQDVHRDRLAIVRGQVRSAVVDPV